MTARPYAIETVDASDRVTVARYASLRAASVAAERQLRANATADGPYDVAPVFDVSEGWPYRELLGQWQLAESGALEFLPY